MRDYEKETKERVAFIRKIIEESGASGIVYGNSGGKDCTLVSILCKMACENTISIMMPCGSKQNYNEDMEHAVLSCKQYSIDYQVIDLTPVKEALISSMTSNKSPLSDLAMSNIAPRLRMTTLYAFGQTNNLLVAGTGNKSERYVGYFTKWGDGACDFNPISDLLTNEVFEFLEYLKAPPVIINKAPSAGLYDGQTDEADMGVSYSQINEHILQEEQALLQGVPFEPAIGNEKILSMHKRSMHKRDGIYFYSK